MGIFKDIADDIKLQITNPNGYLGKHGEDLTENKLKLVNLFGRGGVTLRNVYVPTDNDETTEIDLLYITQKGIFVLESKNYSGWIFGDEKQYQWTASLPNREKFHFYNPIKQNKNHIKWLGEFLQQEIPMFSLIVFSQRCELKKVIITDPNVKVFNRDMTYWVIRKIWESNPDVLTDEQVKEISDKLQVLTNADEAQKLAHVEKIQQKLLTCPKCGSELVLRTARSGVNAGNQFYGCSNFPKCRYTKQK